MGERLASEALSRVGDHDGVRLLATGMSSQAWLGVVDGVRWVVRIPVGDGRRPVPAYRAEADLLRAAARAGVPVAVPMVVLVDGTECALAGELAGRPVRPADWTPELVGDLADALGRLHGLDPGLAVESDLVARFHLASIWPFDDTDLGRHPVTDRWIDLARRIEACRSEIIEAGGPPSTVVHTDLHPDHVLIADGRLVGLLDFGDAFAGPAEWDIAGLRYYHGPVADDVLTDSDRYDRDRARLLTISFALYKLAKQPERALVIERVEPILRTALR